MPKASSTSATVVLYSEAKINAAALLTKFQAKTVDEIEAVAKGEQDNTVRRVGVGIRLRIIKESLDHGEFKPWLAANVKDAGYTQCTYMMRVADAYVAQAGLGRADMLAIANGKAALVPAKKGKPAGKLAKAAAEFVGEKTWGELLAEVIAAEDNGGPTKTTKPKALTADELYERSRDEIGGLLDRAETLFLKENRLQHLVGHPEEINGVVNGLRALADKVEAAAAPILKPAK